MMIGKVKEKDKKIQKAGFFFLLLTPYFLLRKITPHFSRKKGQVAVILILVVAVALIFYAISLNFGRISQTKVVTTIAADTGASLLGSYMASFGQSVFKTSLDGKRKICGWTGLVAAVLAAIIVIIAVAAAAWTAGGSLTLLQVAAVVLALGGVVIQASMVQPGITSGYNAILWHAMDKTDGFTEQGVQTALSRAVTDSAQVADLYDSDGDRVWGPDDNGQPRDKVSRFGFYYRQMRIGTIPLPPATDISDFLTKLDNFLNDGGDSWGIYDKTGPDCGLVGTSSECDHCCVPATDAAGNPFRPSDCPDDATTLLRCQTNSPYGAAYPWVYDAYRENPANDNDPLKPFISFREQLGRDDEHQLFKKNPVDPNGPQTSVLPPPPPLPPTNFKLEDTTGFHAADKRPGVFKFFYKIADWGTNLQSLTTNDSLNPQCNWCNNPVDPSCTWCNAGTPGTTCDATATYPPEFPQLVLPVDPATLPYNPGRYCVDGTNLFNGNGIPPLAVDLVRLPEPGVIPFLGNSDIGKIEATPEPQCAQNSRSDRNMGFWKRGGDRFCSAGGDNWPYWGQCSKYGFDPNDPTVTSPCAEVIDGGTVDSGCACNDVKNPSPPENWPDDLMDDLVYGLNDFIEWASGFVAKGATAEGIATLSKEFKNWYPEAAAWIEPGTDPDPVGGGASRTDPPYCYMCEKKDGALWDWYKDIQEMRKRLEAWRDTSFASTGCDQVWCVPDQSCPGGKDTSAIGGLGPESVTFNAHGGNMEDVVACLNWNVNDLGGNAIKFQTCWDNCKAPDYTKANAWCSSLPRSLVPDFDALVYTPTVIAELVTCRDVTCPDCKDACLADAATCTTACSATAATCVTGCTGNAACIAGCSATETACNAGCSATETACEGACSCTAYATSYSCQGGSIQAKIDSEIAKGSCANAAFMAKLQQSETEAQNQVAKFKLRYDFLNGRLTEMDSLIAILKTAEGKFLEFLSCPDGAACKLIKARIDFDNQDKGLPYYAIYGWQGEPEKGQPPGSGKWHLVRADARIPEKCDNDCNPEQPANDNKISGDPPWPYVRTYTKSWGMKRCFELKGTEGMVKARVSRFDESGTFSTLLFPNAVEIWKPTFSRGDRPLTADPRTIGAVCQPSMAPDPCSGPGPCLNTYSYYSGAFILNKRADNPGCWELANKLLASGVTSEACVQYYFHEGSPNGLDFKFVPCPAF